MQLPFFFVEKIPTMGLEAILDEENSKHIIQVLRMKSGERLLLTDGMGNSVEAEIIKEHKKHCTVNALSARFIPRAVSKTTIAISLVKNNNRFEWFLEKATELGVAEIIPLLCERTEKQHSRHDRFISIATSAMLQSRQSWLPQIHQPAVFRSVVEGSTHHQKFIAHCAEHIKRSLPDLFNSSLDSHIILIGPEGDFTPEEISLAARHHFDQVSLGETRLRTETAGIVAATIATIC